LIFKPVDPTALDDISHWIQIFQSVEAPKVSVWRAIPRNPGKYVAGGELFLNGVDHPTKEQTAHIKAIRKDLVRELEPNHRIGEIKFPNAAALTFWGMAPISILLQPPIGAFIATETSRPIGLTIPFFRFNMTEDSWLVNSYEFLLAWYPCLTFSLA